MSIYGLLTLEYAFVGRVTPWTRLSRTSATSYWLGGRVFVEEFGDDAVKREIYALTSIVSLGKEQSKDAGKR